MTIIESQASINHRLGTPEMWRKPDILVDCVLRLAAKEPSGYACVPGSQPPRLSWPTLGTD